MISFSSFPRYEYIVLHFAHQLLEEPNFRHIVKRQTRFGVVGINSQSGYRAIEIYSPMEIHDEKTEYN